jgi:type II secretory pathway component HofQ
VFTGITVIPRINGDESISMFVTPFVTDVVDTVTGPDGTTAPVLTQQVFPVNRRIRNGETMVIGGLIAKNDQTSIRKVPLLGDLPLIGNLFTGRSLTVSDSELLVFITPSIIRDTVPGGGTATAGGVTP